MWRNAFFLSLWEIHGLFEVNGRFISFNGEFHWDVNGVCGILWDNEEEFMGWLPSGKHTENYGKIHHFYMGKSTISMGHFQ